MLGIIGALDIEVNGIIEKMSDKKQRTVGLLNFTSGTIDGTECVIAKCGVGKVNAAVCTQTMILEYSPDRIINTGIAGGTSDKTHIGSIVIADRVVQHDFDTTVLGDEIGTLFHPDNTSIKYIPCDHGIIRELEAVCTKLGDIDFTVGTIATGDRFMAGIEERQSLNNTFGAIAAEMEGGSIGQVCYLNRIPFCILRSISDDSTSDEGAEVEYAAFSKSAAEKAIRIISTFISLHQ
ncbi:MAG: 5'-methylthioadenosine/adenosylhomocysteine nucleosidase [Clostridia bacterium]|nr:5'-methylthioadenosine/adenosylhomocysteine nucleosidase [Clostridia bacterium]